MSFDEKFFTSHPFFNLSTQVKEICQPFFDSVNINYFDYIRIYDDGKITGLVTDAIWLRHFFEKSFIFGGTVKISGNHLWQSYNNELLLHDARVYFNHDNGISIFYKRENYVEYFDVAAPKENKGILSLYLNRLDILENFFHYFMEQSKQLLHEVSLQPILPPNEMQGTQNFEIDFNDISGSIILNEVSHKKFIYSPLTFRENQCMIHLALGSTLKEIGKTLKLSPRTVEHHVNNIKGKLNCTSRSILIKKYIELVGIAYFNKAIKNGLTT